MSRQNPNLLPSGANLLAAAGAIRSALAGGNFEGLKAALTAAADGFEQGGAAISVIERRLRDLGQPNTDFTGRSAGIVVSRDRVIPPEEHGFGAAFDGGGVALVAGVTAYVTVPEGGTIHAWNLVVDTGTCTITVWKIARGTAIPTVANTISTAGLSISTGTALHSWTLSDFTTVHVEDGDVLGIHLQAVTGATQINFSVELRWGIR